MLARQTLRERVAAGVTPGVLPARVPERVGLVPPFEILRQVRVRRRGLVCFGKFGERAIAHRAERVGVLVLELGLGASEQLCRTIVLAAALDGRAIESIGTRTNDGGGIGGRRVAGGRTESSRH